LLLQHNYVGTSSSNEWFRHYTVGAIEETVELLTQAGASGDR
jgi:hypothetical protein